jgi:hypothetical protein
MTEDLAKRRFLTLQVLRLVALALVMLGAGNIKGKLLPGLSPYLGFALLVFGAVDFFLLPMLLKRIWQKTDQ